MIGRNFCHVRFLPVLCFVWLLLTFIISYAIASSLDHVHPIWPYISDTGTIVPESCIFGLMLNIGAFLMGIIFYIRYQQVKVILKTQETNYRTLCLMNFFCLVTGIAAAFGVCVVANFQETSDMTIHLLGANLAFGVGSACFIVQTAIFFMISKHTVALNYLRVFLCVIYVITFATTMIFANLSFAEYDVDIKGALKWSKDNPGYDYRLASTFSEWVLAIAQGLYILSFTYDFRTINFQVSFSVTDDLANADKSERAIAP